MFTMALFEKIITFLVGETHHVMYTALTFVGINFLLDFFRRYDPPKSIKVLLHEMLKRSLAYIAFVVIATRIDALAVNALFGWDGSTQFLVCLYVVAREVRVILDYIRDQGIDIPLILDSRIGQIERSETQAPDPYANSFRAMDVTPQEVDTDPVAIDAKIARLKEQIADIQALQASNGNPHNGGEV